ncbi:MAG: RNA recognition motif domain-containing protein [Prosthecobacter sp.]
MSNNPNSSNGPRRRRGGRNRGNRGSGSENFTKRTPRLDDRSGLQKFLNVISFGLLCKGPSKAKTKAPITNTTVVKSHRQDGGSSPRPPREPKPAREFTPTNPAEVTTERLYVGNLSYDATESDLFELFNGVGSVRNAEVVVHSRTQRSKGFAFVTMATVEEARRAVAELSGKEFMGRPLQISGAKPSNRGDRDERQETEQLAEATEATVA